MPRSGRVCTPTSHVDRSTAAVDDRGDGSSVSDPSLPAVDRRATVGRAGGRGRSVEPTPVGENDLVALYRRVVGDAAVPEVNWAIGHLRKGTTDHCAGPRR